eukprot:scaffold653047_cov59-Attheya_sp.AAC.2
MEEQVESQILDSLHGPIILIVPCFYTVQIVQNLRWLLVCFESDTTKDGPYLNHKKLEQDTGFLCHIAMMYPEIMPYLKGSYLTLSEHLSNRGKVVGNKRTASGPLMSP